MNGRTHQDVERRGRQRREGEGEATRLGSGAMFDGIADSYDRLNRIISFGVDQGWRRKTVDAMQLAPGYRVLDLATGTADLALMIADRHPGVEVVGVDPSHNMLAIGRDKVRLQQRDDRVRLDAGDAQELPFEDDSFDACCIAFGIRNVPDRPRALREMGRVVRPGGRIAILELSEPRNGLLGPLARFHVHEVVPRLGALLSGAQEYRYLQKSIAAFPSPDAFADIMRGSGLNVEAVRPLTFGVCCLYEATPGVRS